MRCNNAMRERYVGKTDIMWGIATGGGPWTQFDGASSGRHSG